MINGINEKSLKILEDIRSKKGILSDIAKWHGASLNQVNKLSRLNKLQMACNSFLKEDLMIKLKKLGMKALVLSSLVDDPAGMNEVLEVIDIDIKRDDLAMYPKALQEKRKKKKKKEQEAKVLLYKLEQKEEEINNNINKLIILKKESDKALKEFSDMTDNGKEFIMEHLGIFKGKYILKARLDIPWQKNLKNKGIIKYDPNEFVNYIVNIQEFKKQIEKRIKNNNYMYYDTSRREEWELNYPYYAEYKIGDKVIEDIATGIKENKKALLNFEKEKKEIRKEIEKLKKESSGTYMKQAIISNTLSANELIKHTKLQNSAMRWLYKDGNVSVTEISKENYRFDVIGYNELDEVIIIEAKASIQDFKRDNKLEKYKNYCNKMYVIIDSQVFYKLPDKLINRLKESKIGLLVEERNENISTIIESDVWNLDKNIITSLKFDIVRKLSEKYIYNLK